MEKYNLFIKKLDENCKEKTIYFRSDPVSLILNKLQMDNELYYLNHNNCLINYDPIKIDQKNKKDIPPKVKEKKFINIECEINNISDLLTIIEKYKYDSDCEYNIDLKAIHNIKRPLEKLNNLIGMNDLKVNIVEQIIYFLQQLNDNNEGEFMHTVISGPPGTGKTEIAKLMGKIFCKIGKLKKGVFNKVTRSDLIAGYLGQTALKTKDVIKDSLGGVLFIDEAYALGNDEKRDSFSKECIDTLCEALSDHKDNLMVIIAGYEKELSDCFFNYNKGLESRFVWRFKTDDYKGEDLYHIFLKKIKDINWCLHETCELDSKWFVEHVEDFPYYGRDIETLLAKVKICHSNRVFCKPIENKKKLTMDDIENGFKKFLSHKNKKEKNDLKQYLQNTLYC